MQLVTSDWPSVCDRNAEELRQSLTPARVKKFVQSLLVNTGSLSLTMEQGRQCRLTIWSKKTLAMDVAV